MTFHRPTRDVASGKWRGILMHLGVSANALTGKHSSCPLCGGTDRFRFDNQDGRGTWICTNCGAGDGMALAEKFTGKPFRDVAAQVDAILGNERIETDKPKREYTDEERRAALRAVWSATKPMQKGDLADIYLTARRLDEMVYPAALRFGASLRDGDGGVRPCMVAIVSDAEGKPVTLHRTFLRTDGGAKAEMEAPRKLMPGDLPEGSAVRLSEYTGGALGIAEGIETALAASARFDLPVWSAINTTILAKWWPPAGCEEVAIFADNDEKFGGQAAAYRLAFRLACKGIAVTVHVPPLAGQDWADVWFAEKGLRA